jgi:hypothetical protein
LIQALVECKNRLVFQKHTKVLVKKEIIMKSKNKLAMMFLLAFAVISLVFGATFIYQGVNANNMLIQGLAAEKVTYAAEDAKGAIKGVVDTPEEAVVMSNILKAHRVNDYGYYAELKRDDPKRDQILKALTMENSLNLAQIGFGLATVIIVIGVFMLVQGAALFIVAYIIRPRINTDV